MAAEPFDDQDPEDISGAPVTPDAAREDLNLNPVAAAGPNEGDDAPDTAEGDDALGTAECNAPTDERETALDSDEGEAAPGAAEREAAPGAAEREAAPGAAEREAAPAEEVSHAMAVGEGRQLWEEDWQELEPAELAGLLAGTDPASLDDWSVLEYLKAVRKHDAWTQSRRVRATSRFAALRPATGSDAGAPDGISRYAAGELAPILAIPGKKAAAELADAHQITTYLPGTLAALDAAEIDLSRATAIARKGSDLMPEALAEYEARVLPGAGEITLESVQARARTVRDWLHPEPLEARHKAAMERRTVQYVPQDDGMAELYIRTSAEKALLAYNLMQAHARKLQGADEARTLGQLRADVFTDMLIGYPDHAYQPAHSGDSTEAGSAFPLVAGTGSSNTGKAFAGGPCTCGGGNVTASVAVTAPLGTLLGLTEEPGELTGYGLIPPGMTRDLVALAKSWLVLLTDDYGRAVAAAKDLRSPPEWLKRLVRIRDRNCREFGCTAPADQCEIDHTIAWEDGGKTVLENLGAFCKPGHKAKHHAGGTVTQGHDGTLHFTTPSGHTYTTTPDEDWAITIPEATGTEENTAGRRQDETTEEDAAGRRPEEPPWDETPPPF